MSGAIGYAMKSIAVAVLLLVVTGLSACGLRAMEDQVVFLDPN